MPDPTTAQRAYIHVGAPKTGTTFLQGVVWRNAPALRQAGIDMIGRRQAEHYRAGHDLRDIAFDPDDPGVDWTGAWDALAAKARSSTAGTVIISDEHLAALTPAQVQRAVDTLAPREVHVVYATRALADVLPSEWQEFVKHGSVLDYPEWARRVLTAPRRGPGRWFWSVQDPVGVVRRWSCAVPAERIHVVTMPNADAHPQELWRRFASVLDVPPEVAADFDVPANPSLDVAHAEVLRRVNERLPPEFPRWHRTGIVRDVLAVQVLSGHGGAGRPVLSPDLHEQVRRRSERAVAGLRRSRVQIVGDLNDIANATTAHDESAAVPDDAQLLDASVDAITGLVVQMSRMRDERGRAEHRLREQLRTAPRLRRYRDRFLELEERSALVAWTGCGLRAARDVARKVRS